MINQNEREIASLDKQSRIKSKEDYFSQTILNEGQDNFFKKGLNKFIEYSKSEEGKKDYTNVLDKLGKSLMGIKNNGSMVSGHYVPGSSSFGSAFLNEINNQEQKDLINKELVDKKEQRDQDIAYKNEMLKRRDLMDKNEMDLRNFDKTIKNKQLQLEEDKLKAMQSKNKLEPSLTEENSRDIKQDIENLQQALRAASPYMGSGSIKSLQRSMGNVFKGSSFEAIKNLESVVNNFMARNIRKLPAYKQGVLTDADFKNAVKGVFDVGADVETNIKNVNAILRSMGADEKDLIQDLSKSNNEANNSLGWIKHG